MKQTVFFIGFLLGLILFFPVKELFFYTQRVLQKKDIHIQTKIKNSFLPTFADTKIYKNNILLFNIQKATLKPFIFYNKMEIKNLKGLNIKIKDLNITYTVFNPFEMQIKATSNLSSLIQGEINLKKHFVKIYLQNPKDSIKRLLKKDDKGYYYYAIY